MVLTLQLVKTSSTINPFRWLAVDVYMDVCMCVYVCMDMCIHVCVRGFCFFLGSIRACERTLLLSRCSVHLLLIL